MSPAHLRWRTYRANHMEKRQHGTFQEGEKHGRAKLTKHDIRDIRAAKGVSQRALAARYGVSQSTLWAALHGKTWS